VLRLVRFSCPCRYHQHERNAARRRDPGLLFWPCRVAARLGAPARCPILGTSGGDEPRRLWRDKERTEEARELLAPVYGQFTEGFETTSKRQNRWSSLCDGCTTDTASSKMRI